MSRTAFPKRPHSYASPPDHAQTHGRKLPTAADLGLALALIYPSLAIFRMPGWTFAAAYVVIAMLTLWVVKQHVVPRLYARISAPAATLSLLLVLLSLTALHLLIHPRIAVTGFELAGFSVGAADMDDAINAALSSLFSGNYPFHARTFLDNPITPMPGTLLLAAPFYWLGYSTLQNLFWLGIFFAIAGWHHGDVRLGTWLLAISLGVSPAILYHLLQGIDYISNNIYVLLAALLVVRFAEKRAAVYTLLSAAFLGIALSSRLSFLLVVPLVLLAVAARGGLRLAMTTAVTTGAAFLAVTLPFYLADPEGFSPLHTLGIAPSLAGIPYSSLLAPALCGLLAIVLGLRVGSAKPDRVMRNAFIVQVTLFLTSAALASWATGSLEVRFAHFGVLAMFFGIYYFGPRYLHEALRQPAQGDRPVHAGLDRDRPARDPALS